MTPDQHRHPELDLIVVEGPEYQRLGGPPIRKGGLVQQVVELDAKVDSLLEGQFTIKLPGTAWVAIIVAIVAGVAQVIAALVSAG